MSENAWATVEDDPEAPRVERPAPADLPPPRTKSVRRPGRPRSGEAKPKPRTRNKTPEPEPTNYTESLNGTFVQLPAAVLFAIGSQRNNVLLLADAYTLAKHGPPVTTAVNEIAQKDARWAAILDRITAVGPYGALVMAVVPMIAQFAANHGAPKVLGAVSVEELLKEAGYKAPSPNGQGERGNTDQAA